MAKSKEEQYAKQQEWRRNNRERVNNLARIRHNTEINKAYETSLERVLGRKNRNLIRNYGITLEDYNKMFGEQNGCCAICGKHQQDLKASLHVDHNHTTGAVRGLLCHHCNVGLGHFEDNITLLSNAIAYLEEV
jgi:hypothetical protein